MSTSRNPLTIGLGAHHKASMPVQRSPESGSWLVLRDWERQRLTIATPFAPVRREMSDEVRAIVDRMAGRLAANAEMLSSSASWVSASGRVTHARINDPGWVSRYVAAHLTVTIGLPETPASRQRAAR